MTPERHRQIGEVFDAALKLEPAWRTAFLDQACAEDPGLRREVESLLASHEKAGEFIAAPALEVAAKAFAMDTDHSAMTLASGTRLGPYEILSLIGVGGMGEVYKASDTRLNRAVAVKVLPAHFSENLEMKQRFEREAQTIAGLNHPHICTLYDVGHQDGTDFLVMEYLEGETLAERLQRGALPLEDTLRIAMEVAQALDKAHRQRVTHRDLKPSNIMLTKSGAKLLDFGLAKLRRETQPASTLSAPPTNAAVTAEGMILGTLEYMSPEQLEGKEIDARADIFAFGATVYEMVTGKKAFEGKSQASLIAAILDRDPAPMSSMQPRTPPHLDHIVMRCLAKDPDQRWQTASDIQHELEWLAEEPASNKPESAAAIDSLAVLPLVNTGGNPDTEYLSDGITEGLINSLSQIPKLRVVPRSSVFRYKGSEIDTKKVGRQLKVRALLMGKVLQRGDTLNVQVELVDVKREAQLWGERFVRRVSDIFAVEEEIARQITEKLRFKITGEERERLSRRYTEDTVAYQLYLKGRYHWSKRTGEGLKKSVEYFEQAIARDTNYALPYAGLADAYVVMSCFDAGVPRDLLSKAKTAALRAVEIDPDLPEAHAELCLIWPSLDRDWAAAEDAFRRAMQRKPAYWLAHNHYAFVLAAQGRSEEAMAEVRHGQALEPLSLVVHHHVAWVSLLARRYDDAIAESRSALEMDPTFGMAHRWMGIGLEQKGLYEEAITSLDQAVKFDGGTSISVAAAAHAYAMSGRIEEARRRLVDLQQAPARRYVEPYALALISAALSNHEQALQWLEQAYRDHSLWFAMWAKADPRLDVLRHDARFQDLLRRMGLEE